MIKRWITPETVYYSEYVRLLQQPHILIAGTTGSGKSVFIGEILRHLLARAPSDVAFFLIDPKRVDMSQYRHLPHVTAYADTIPGALQILRDAARIMERRFCEMKKAGAVESSWRDLYIIIDELADLMLTAGKDAAPLLQHILQLGRAARVHIIAATQCPARQVIPAPLVLNFTARVALRCLSPIESRQIIGTAGAETLPRYGQFIAADADGVRRCVAEYHPDELKQTAQHWTQAGQRAARRRLRKG